MGQSLLSVGVDVFIFVGFNGDIGLTSFYLNDILIYWGMKERVVLIRDMLRLEPSEGEIGVEGWIRSARDTKNVLFIAVSDGSCIETLQCIIDKESYGVDPLVAAELKTGASVCAFGKLVASPGGKQAVELLCSRIVLVGRVEDDFPMQKKRHSFEFLREVAHLRARTNVFGAIARVRSTMSFAIHSFFNENGFFYVHTPIITASDCEGAGEMFQVTTLDLDGIAKNPVAEIDYSRDFFGKKASLTVSGQLSAETYACALKNVYTFGPTFRAENSNTSRHLAEFWMVEPEMAFCSLEGNMDVAERFIKFVLQYVLDHCPSDMEFFDSFVQKGTIDTLKGVIEKPFVRITYTEAMEKLVENGDKFEFKPVWGCDLQSEHEKFLTEQVYNSPVIVTDYPKGIKAFYMKENADGKTVRAMDILVPRLGEIIGGSERESDYDTLVGRIEAAGLNKEDYWWYLDLRRHGTVPHSGFGLGFERLILYVTGMANIRDVIPYARSVKNCDF